MELTYWQKQADKPIYADLEWSRPENKNQAGNLLVVGGSPQDFKGVSEAYQAAEQAGAGTVKVALPKSLEKIVGKIFSDAHFLPDNAAGTFSQAAIASLIGYMSWANGLLVPGSVGNNSETTATMSKYLHMVEVPTVIAGDAIQMLKNDDNIFMNQSVALVLNLPQLQSLSLKAGDGRFITSKSGLVQLVEFLHMITREFNLKICLVHEQDLIVAENGEVVSTRVTHPRTHLTAAYISVYWMQFPGQFMQAATAACWKLK